MPADYLERRRKLTQKPPKLSKQQEMAIRIMSLADRHSKDGELSILELKTFLERTEFQEFMMYTLRWPDTFFHQMDTDNSGKLNMKELEEIVGGFLVHQREKELKLEEERRKSVEARKQRKTEREMHESHARTSKAAATSHELMEICDRNSRNGLLTCLEIESFCTDPKYRDFLNWLRADNYKVLKSHDVDRSGDISRAELEEIVGQYYREVLIFVFGRGKHTGRARLFVS